MENGEYPRRQFINRCLVSAVLFLGGSLTNGCGSNNVVKEDKVGEQSGQSCDDLSDVNAQEIEKRQKFGYVNQSPDPDQFCDNCGLYIQPVNKNCGGCMLFKGPVDPAGYCIQYVAKQ